MKKTLIILVLLFSSSVFADDISDFQIEGISIGDSMLDFFSKEDMQNATNTYFYKDNKYMYYFFYKFPTLKTFDGVQVTVKPNDNKYIIYGVEGVLNYKYDIEDCYKKQEEIKKELDKIFKTDGIKDTGKHPMDPTGNSKYTRYSYFDSNSEFVDPVKLSAELNCYYAGKEFREKGQSHALYVILTSEEFNTFLFYEQFE